MAEYCLECFKKYIATEEFAYLTEKDAVCIPDYCEGCGEWKPCVVRIKERSLRKRFTNGCFRTYNRIKFKLRMRRLRRMK